MQKYIDAEMLETALRKLVDDTDCNICIMPDVMGIVREQPVANVKEVVHGDWVKQDCQGDYGLCSICNCRIPWIPKNYKFCPGCGADMRGKQEYTEHMTCIHNQGNYCEVISDKEVRQPCIEGPCDRYQPKED